MTTRGEKAIEVALLRERGLTYQQIADELGMREGAVKVAVHRMRKRCRELLRAEIAETVAGPDAIAWARSTFLSPGVRWAYNFRNGLQIVPGIAVPLGVGAAIYLAELAPAKLSSALTFLVELLAAVPSVIYGLLAIFVLGAALPMIIRLTRSGRAPEPGMSTT